jgi:hypothetical protein
MGTTDGDGDHGVGRPAEAGESGQGKEGASAALRLLVVQNDPESGPGTLEHALRRAGPTSSSGCRSGARTPLP